MCDFLLLNVCQISKRMLEFESISTEGKKCARWNESWLTIKRKKRSLIVEEQTSNKKKCLFLDCVRTHNIRITFLHLIIFFYKSRLFLAFLSLVCFIPMLNRCAFCVGSMFSVLFFDFLYSFGYFFSTRS